MLHEPVLLVMLTGWIDASGAAPPRRCRGVDRVRHRAAGPFDDDTFVDYRARRPTMELRDGLNTDLVWPTIELRAGRAVDGHDVLLLTGSGAGHGVAPLRRRRL